MATRDPRVHRRRRLRRGDTAFRGRDRRAKLRGDMRGVHDIARCAALLGPLIAAAGCGLEQGGTGPEFEVDEPVDAASAPTAPTARMDAGPRRPPVGEVTNHAADTGDDAGALGQADAGCDFVGSYAMRTEFDVSWDRTMLGLWPLVDEGRDVFTVYSRAQVRIEGGKFLASIQPCGAEVPDFRNVSRIYPELYGVHVPNAAWDYPGMPRWEVEWAPACRHVGCAVHSSPLDVWIGAERAHDPVQAARGDMVPVDVDGDGAPGLTLLTRTPDEINRFGEPYHQPPLGFGRLGRAQQLMMAISTRTTFQGTVESCGAIKGEGTDAHVRGVAVGCTSEVSATTLAACEPSLVRAVDANLPAWKVTAVRYRTERVDDARCDKVRARYGSP
jgi:hypothetical protein